jgi:hypothetical protein
MRNFIQYELWKDCSNACKFCFNKGQKDLDKIESLNFVMDKLDDPEVDEYEEIGFIGGEFFDTQLDEPRVKELFYKLFDKCIEKIHSHKIDKLYITTALLFDMNKYLIPFLDYLRDKGVLENVLLCTSFDLKYRFHTEKRRKLWEDNMLKLHQLYPTLRLHTETIVTGFFVNAVLNGEFSISEFCDKFHTHIDYIEAGSGFYYYDKKECAKDMPDFFPTKDNFIKFLYKVAIENKEIDLNTFISPNVRSDKIYCNYNGKRYIMSNRRKSNMTISVEDLKVKYETGLIDSNEKMLDIVQQLKQLYEE